MGEDYYLKDVNGKICAEFSNGLAPIIDLTQATEGIEGKLHQRLDATLDEDRSRVRTPRGLTVLGMFRRLGVSFACAWLTPQRRKQKQSARDFLDHLNAENARRAFSLVTSACPKAWRGG